MTAFVAGIPQTPLELMTPEEISNKMVEKEKELQEYERRDAEVTTEKYRLEKEIALLRINLNETKSMLAMSDSNIKRVRSELRMMERMFWNKKRQ